MTNRQFKAFVDETGYRTERELDGLGKSIWYKLREAPLEEKLDHPVVCVTRKDALAYCEWFSRGNGYRNRLTDRGTVGESGARLRQRVLALGE